MIGSLEDGDPRKVDGGDPWKIERDFRAYRQDVWWMFYQKDPTCEEPFSLESCCEIVAGAFRMSFNADAVRESCFRQGFCPPESKIVKRRCKRARIMVLSNMGQGGPSK